VLACRVAAPSRWDSNVALLAVVEKLTAAVTERLGNFARNRIEELERLREATAVPPNAPIRR
jgi:DNA-binding MurR/RpiR family transcriptional regulator